jgi:hypothetical protein
MRRNISLLFIIVAFYSFFTFLGLALTFLGSTFRVGFDKLCPLKIFHFSLFEGH